ncbi:MAG: hypothetical protein KAT39_01135, partial [Alphaproteobacteria bacterium]|nr:hypothetical protein [Alphaproteobacteria bacterium]
MEILMQNLQGSLGNPENLILFLMFATVVLLVMGGAGVLAGANPVKRRLKTRVRRVVTEDLRGGNIAKAGKGLARKMEQSQSENDPGKTTALRRKLVMAGYLGSSAVSIFLLCRFVAAAVAPVITLIVAPYFAGSMPPSELAIVGVVAAVIGFYLPSLWVSNRIGARQDEARQGFP